jgi:hypothetical protein
MTWLTVIEYLCHKWPRICSTCRKHFPVRSSFMTYHRVCCWISTTGATIQAGTAYPSGAHEFTPSFKWGTCYSIFSFICMFCRSLFVLLYFFFWPLFFFDMRILIVPLVSSNSSKHFTLYGTLSDFPCYNPTTAIHRESPTQNLVSDWIALWVQFVEPSPVPSS